MTIAITRPFVVRELIPETSVLGDRIALIDSDGNIVALNDAWREFAAQAGTSLGRVRPGANYFKVCLSGSSSNSDGRGALNGIRAVIERKLLSFTMDYWCDLPVNPSYFRMCVTPIDHEEACCAISHTNISDLWLSKEKSTKQLRKIARRLINAQEEERKRISQELHDDLGTRVALLSFAVRRMVKQRPQNSSPRMDDLNEVIDTIGDLSNALRDLSHCMYPPLLRHAGIGAALKGLCEQFKKTHGIDLQIVVPSELPPLSDEVGLCLFRVSQECLHNIAEHAEASSASVVLEHTGKAIRLMVSDNGRGFVPRVTLPAGGLGFISMEERVLGLGGTLEIESLPNAGTRIRVVIQLHKNRLSP